MQILRGLVCRSMIQTVECVEGLTGVKREGTDIERVSVQEHGTDSTVWRGADGCEEGRCRY